MDAPAAVVEISTSRIKGWHRFRIIEVSTLNQEALMSVRDGLGHATVRPSKSGDYFFMVRPDAIALLKGHLKQ
jgi:hypothetical protein